MAVLAVAMVLGGCSGKGEGVGLSGLSPSRPSTTTTSPPRLDAPVPYVPVPGEVEQPLKSVAAVTMQTLMTYDSGNSSAEAARQRLIASGAPPQIADKAGSVLVAGSSSAADIVYPQLGGLTSERASVMLVVRQRLLNGAERQTVVRTVDVRLLRSGALWVIEDVASFGGEAVSPPAELPASARRVLADPAIDLPDSARWDISAGLVSEPVLALLADLAQRHRLGVTVFATGHPHEVFGTTRLSNHTRGAAVDLWLVDTPVVSQRAPNGRIPGLVSDLLALGVTELGAPFDVDGPGGANFTDMVHQDHLHIAIR